MANNIANCQKMDTKIFFMVVLALQCMALIEGAPLIEDSASNLNQIEPLISTNPDKQKYKRDLSESGLWSEPLIEPWHAGSSGWDHSSGWKPITSIKNYPRQTISAVLRKLNVPVSFVPIGKYIPDHLDGHIGSIGHLGPFGTIEPIHHIGSIGHIKHIGSDILHLNGGFHGGSIASADHIGHVNHIGSDILHINEGFHGGSIASAGHIGHVNHIGSDILHINEGFHGGSIASAGLIGHGLSLHGAPILKSNFISHSIPIHDGGFAVGSPHLIGGEKGLW